jgi:hypothetical protein
MNMQTGAGGVIFDVMVTGLLWLAALLQLAVVRDETLPESRTADAARWIVAVGLCGMALRFTFVLIDTGDILVPPYSLLPVALIALGMIALAMDRLRRPRFKRRAEDHVLPGDIHPSQWPTISGAGPK